MNKRDKIIELLARGLSYNLKYNTLADKIISITNRVKCEKCEGFGHVGDIGDDNNIIATLCLHCKDGWIYPDPQKMYEALKQAKTFIEYARYELDVGKATIGCQFPKQEDADIVIEQIKQVIRGE